ncbi:MAG: hypothetical protein LC660_08755, partial [Desulfobacteraceae bacterium]|nr:hypothetical protein [Desulfobacteraceae bacterium]
MEKDQKPGPDRFQNNSFTLEYLDHGPSRDQILSVDPFAFKDRDTLFRYLDQNTPKAAAGIFFQPPPSEQAGSGLLSCMNHLSLWLAKKPASMVFAVSVRLDISGKPVDKNQLAAWKENGLRLIHWQCAPKETKIPDNLLWQVSSQRIWNHVSIPGFSSVDNQAEPVAKCIMDNPHIVHSFDIPGNEVPVAGAYDKVAPLPGRPVWKFLGTLDRLLACMTRVPMEHLIRLRYHDNRLISLGRDIAYYFTPPADLPPGYLDMVCAMVAAGGSVDPAHVRSNLEKAYLIG